MVVAAAAVAAAAAGVFAAQLDVVLASVAALDVVDRFELY